MPLRPSWNNSLRISSEAEPAPGHVQVQFLISTDDLRHTFTSTTSTSTTTTSSSASFSASSSSGASSSSTVTSTSTSSSISSSASPLSPNLIWLPWPNKRTLSGSPCAISFGNHNLTDCSEAANYIISWLSWCHSLDDPACTEVVQKWDTKPSECKTAKWFLLLGIKGLPKNQIESNSM